jgi:peptidoglycan/LPS O-acetylase OafA/YrhL
MIQTNSDRVMMVDLLRIVAISMVIFSHILFTVGNPWDHLNQLSFGIYPFIWKTWGQVGVTVFLIISGFSLEYANGQKKISLGRFYMKRIARIYPIYYISLLIGLVLKTAFAYWGYLHGRPFVVLPDFGSVDIIMTLTASTVFFGKWGGAIIQSSWFIGVIMVMYFFYPVISWGCKKSPWICISLLFLASVTSRTLIGESKIFSGDPMEWFPLNRIFEFGLGVLVARFISQDFLRGTNDLLQRLPCLTSLSALSFPFFLIHDPLRRFIVIGPVSTISLAVGTSVFLLLSVILSKIALIMDERIKNKLLGTFLPWAMRQRES